MKVRVRQIYFSPMQIGMCEFEPYFNKTADKYLESSVMLKLWQERDYQQSEYYGIFSYQFRNKIRKSKEFVYSAMAVDNYEADIYTFFASNKQKINLWEQGDLWHPLFSQIGILLFEKLGYTEDIIKLDTPSIYCNHFIIKSEFFNSFCKDLLYPAIKMLNTDEELIKLCNENPDYRSTIKAKPERCLQIFGKPYYTYHPFICERLISTYVALCGLKLKHI